MLVDQAGALIADILTANPSLSGISSASAILDTSNYTIQAIAFGKGTSGYQNHASLGGNITAGSTRDVITVTPENLMDTSSYQTSALNYPVMSYPDPRDIRLEKRTTQTKVPSFDLGHNLNAINFSATNGFGESSTQIGCYPSSGGTGYQVVTVDYAGNILTTIQSGIFHSKYNLDAVMDPSGMVHMTVANIDEGNAAEIAGTDTGLILASDNNSDNFSSTGRVNYITSVSAGDFGAAALFGGIYGMGLYYIDMKTMLSEGKTPPYGFDALNNERRYKLFAKRVFSKDLTHHADSTASDNPADESGLKSFESVNASFSSHETLNVLKIIWGIEF
jgi:hypothetical protein